MTPQDKSLQSFLAQIKDSVENHAKRKNYTKNDADGENQLAGIMTMLGIGVPHAIGEIIYKCAEFLKTPRKVLLVKIAGWAFILWRECDIE